MRRYVTIFAVFMAFLFSSQFVSAQEATMLTNEQVKEKAQEDTKKLGELVSFEGNQEKEVFKVFLDMETNMNIINQDEKSKFRIPVVMEQVDARLSNILNTKQYQLYLDSKEND